MPSNPMHWAYFDGNKLDSVVQAIERYEEKFKRRPTIIWTNDGWEPEGLRLAAKQDDGVLPNEFTLE